MKSWPKVKLGHVGVSSNITQSTPLVYSKSYLVIYFGPSIPFMPIFSVFVYMYPYLAIFIHSYPYLAIFDFWPLFSDQY